MATENGADSHLVTATEEANNNKPKFTKSPPSEVIVDEGGSLQLSAQTLGTPTPEVKWLKNGKEISRINPAYLVKRINGEDVLEVSTVVSKTTGLFTCVASNVHGESKCTSNVVVKKQGIQRKRPTELKDNGLDKKKVKEDDKVAPVFTVCPKDVTVTIGETAEFTVKLEGNPTVNWSFAGKVLKESEKIQVSDKDIADKQYLV